MITASPLALTMGLFLTKKICFVLCCHYMATSTATLAVPSDLKQTFTRNAMRIPFVTAFHIFEEFFNTTTISFCAVPHGLTDVIFVIKKALAPSYRPRSKRNKTGTFPLKQCHVKCIKISRVIIRQIAALFARVMLMISSFFSKQQ